MGPKGVISGGSGLPRASGCIGGGRISILNVSEDCFCDIVFRGFRSDSGGRVSMILGRSVGRSVSQALGRSVGPPPLPPRPKRSGVW